MSYVELHCHSYFSLLDGASPPEALVARAAELGMPALALTDHDAVYGAVRFVKAAREAGIQPILGAELTTDEGHLTVLVENAAGWQNLCWLISQARANAPKGEALLPTALLEGHTGGLIALSGCRAGVVSRHRSRAAALKAIYRYRDLFGPESFLIELQHHLLPGDADRIGALAALAWEAGVGVVATNDVHYACRDSHRLQDVLVCIRHNTAIDRSAHLRRPNSEFYLKPHARMIPLFARHPEALTSTLHIAERCQFELAFGLQDLPPFPTPVGMEAVAYLRHLCEEALIQRYPDAPSKAREQLAYELRVIDRAGLANYFLVVWDIVSFARRSHIHCQGRGSAANSLVAYLLGISPIDPLRHNLVFERFLSEERQVVPDIDIDFDAARREEVIQYVYDRYGRDHAAMACTFITYRARSALRAVGKALGFPPTLIDRAAKLLDVGRAEDIGESMALREALGDHIDSPLWAQLLDLCRQIDGFPRHLGIHNGGMVITGPPLAHHLPTEPATMPDRTVVQWDKDGLEDAGLVKIDLLGLRMLSAIADALAIIEEATGERPGLDRLAFDDPAVYALIARPDTVGVFQVESHAQSQLQPRLKPQRFEDLIVGISLIRPGPIQGNMVHPYLRRRQGLEPVTYLHPLLKSALAETLGVIIYQEQVLTVARDLAGFTPGQGEVLRRALGARDAREAVEALRESFLQGALARGVAEPVAGQVFEALKAFAGYAFPKSHAAAFAVLVYQSAWLKRYHPAAFYAGLLNNQPMGFWPPSVIVNDARRHGIEVLPVDINRSGERCTVVEGKLRLGLVSVAGIGAEGAARIGEARARGPFTSLDDFCQRTALPKRLVERLVRVGAMDAWGAPRRTLLWELGKLRYPVRELVLAYPPDDVDFPALTRGEVLADEYELLGLSTGDHPMALIREQLNGKGLLTSRGLAAAKHGQTVRIAGVQIMHQAPPTAKGVRFVTLEDEWGMIDVVIRPDVYPRCRRALHGGLALIVEGKVERADGVVNLLAETCSDFR